MGRPFQGGYLTPKGYRRTHTGKRGGLRMVHDLVWERYHGPIPLGHDVHHLDGNKQNNDIGNLQLIDKLTHKRIHGGCELREGVWWKPCGKCGVMKCVDTDFYQVRTRGSIDSECKSCRSARSVSDKKLRKLPAQ